MQQVSAKFVLKFMCSLYYSAGYFPVSELIQHELSDLRLCKMIVQNSNTVCRISM